MDSDAFSRESYMLTPTHLANLQHIRLEFEEAAGPDWPAGCEDPLLLLADVCGALDLDHPAVVTVLGPLGWRYVDALLTGSTLPLAG